MDEVKLYWNRTPHVMNNELSKMNALGKGIIEKKGKKLLIKDILQKDLFTEDDLTNIEQDIKDIVFADDDPEVFYFIEDVFKYLCAEYKNKTFLLEDGTEHPFLTIPPEEMGNVIGYIPVEKQVMNDIIFGEEYSSENRKAFLQQIRKIKRYNEKHRFYEFIKENPDGTKTLIRRFGKYIDIEGEDRLLLSENGTPLDSKKYFLKITFPNAWNFNHGYGKIRPHFYSLIRNTVKTYTQKKIEEVSDLYNYFTSDEAKEKYPNIAKNSAKINKSITENLISLQSKNTPIAIAKLCERIYKFYLKLVYLQNKQKDEGVIHFNLKELMLDIYPSLFQIDKRYNTQNTKWKTGKKEVAYQFLTDFTNIFHTIAKDDKTTGFPFLPIVFLSVKDYEDTWNDPKNIENEEDVEIAKEEVKKWKAAKHDFLCFIRTPEDAENLIYNLDFNSDEDRLFSITG